MKILEIRSCNECPFHDVVHYKDYCVKVHQYIIITINEFPLVCPLKNED